MKSLLFVVAFTELSFGLWSSSLIRHRKVVTQSRQEPEEASPTVIPEALSKVGEVAGKIDGYEDVVKPASKQIVKAAEAISKNLEDIIDTELLECHCKCCKASTPGPTTHVMSVEEEVAAGKKSFLQSSIITNQKYY